jgi:hypothetical protein
MNKNIRFMGKDIVLTSEAGPLETVIDCEYDGRAFNIREGETAAAVIEGITVLRAYSLGHGAGARLIGSSPTFVRCVFHECHLDGQPFGDLWPAFGATIYAEHSDFLLQNCSILGSSMEGEPEGGTAIAMYDARATLRNCLVAHNTGGSLYACETEPCVFDFDRCIFSCNDLPPARGYITVPDPGLCDWPASIQLCEDSPALPDNNPWGEVVGAIDAAGCGPCLTSVEQTSWGSIKALYR